MSETAHEPANVLGTGEKPNDLDTKEALGPVLARLVDEVRNQKAEGPHAYNRMHNRHNRSR